MMNKYSYLKTIFITLPLVIFLLLIIAGYFTSGFWGNLAFCLASADLGIIATFLVLDKFYKSNEILENKKLLLILAQSYNLFVLNTYFTIVASYIFDIKKTNNEIFKNKDLMIAEIDKLINIIETYTMNDFSKYKNNKRTQIQLNSMRKNIDEIKELFLYLPKSLDIYKNCFPLLLNVITYFQYLELRIMNKDTMLDVDFSTMALIHLNNFNKAFMLEVKKLNDKEINNIIFFQ